MVASIELTATLASRDTAVPRKPSQYTSYSEYTGSIENTRFSAAITRIMRVVLRAKQSTAHNDRISAVYNPRISPLLAVSARIAASTGSARSIEPRNTRSSGSINAQNPKFCECTRSVGSIER